MLYTFFRMVYTFDEPTSSSLDSFIYTGITCPGSHSVIVYLPDKNTFYCKNISIDDKRFSMLGLKDISKKKIACKHHVTPSEKAELT